MNAESEATRDVIHRFHRAFAEHRPADLDGLIGEGCVLEEYGTGAGRRAP